MRELLLVPFGDISPEISSIIRDELASRIPILVASSDALPVPDGIRCEDRVHAEDFLSGVRDACVKSGCYYGIGVFSGGLYVNNADRIFGFNFMTSAVVGLESLRVDDQELFRMRVVKSFLQEAGHLFGLRNCRNKDCVMHFAGSLKSLDSKGADYCRSCISSLSWLGK